MRRLGRTSRVLRGSPAAQRSAPESIPGELRHLPEAGLQARSPEHAAPGEPGWPGGDADPERGRPPGALPAAASARSALRECPAVRPAPRFVWASGFLRASCPRPSAAQWLERAPVPGAQDPRTFALQPSKCPGAAFLSAGLAHLVFSFLSGSPASHPALPPPASRPGSEMPRGWRSGLPFRCEPGDHAQAQRVT